MKDNYKNYYKISREHAGLTQETAAEYLNISPRSLSAYENWETTPPNDVVSKMVKLYKTKLLGWWHLRNTSELAKECLPDIQELQTNADIFLQAEFADDEVISIRTMSKQLLMDGKITEDEIAKYEELRNMSKKAAGKLMSIFTYEPKIGE